MALGVSAPAVTAGRPVTVADVAFACSGVIVPAEAGSEVVRGLEIDSRTTAPGDLFVALPGERVDGHAYVESALRAGACAALVAADRDPASWPGPVVVVADPGAALADLARDMHGRLREGGTRTIAITGSNGKTTTKDLLAHVLTEHPQAPDSVSAAPGSYNNDLGLPITVVRAGLRTPAPAFLVLEMGARGIGHIRRLCAIAPPDLAVVLMVASAHLAEFGSRAALAAAKAELVESLTEAGVAVLNADDPLVSAMSGRVRGRVLTFGTGVDADVRALDVDEDAAARATFRLTVAGASADVHLGVAGIHHVTNALAVAAVAITEGMDVVTIARRLSMPVAISPHRMAVTHRPDGVTVIDDAYNANPEAMAAALRSLAVMGRGRRTWAVLGEMLELGDEATEQHDRLGRLAVRLNVDRLIAVGEGARTVHLAAAHEGSWGGESQWVSDAEAAADVLSADLEPGDVVLVKASNSVGLWRLAGALAAQPTPTPPGGSA